ncbi:MAG: energy-coupled thiamine transporter ThiT [Synergistetes bacterium]|nr:energy-coupled thiamine transporter ThiT [Synergistota bacterium]
MLKSKDVTEIGLVAGIAFGLSFIKLYHMPQGGSITLENIPVIVYAILRGWRRGVIAGSILGLLIMVSDPYFVHPLQIVLDYPLPFALLGISGMFSNIYLGIVAGIAGKFFSHWLSGVVFFASYAPKGVSPLVYSAIYNGTTTVPNLVIALILVPLILRKLRGGRRI